MMQAQDLDSSNLDSSSFVSTLFWFTRYKNLNKFQVRSLQVDFMFLKQLRSVYMETWMEGKKTMNIILFE